MRPANEPGRSLIVYDYAGNFGLIAASAATGATATIAAARAAAETTARAATTKTTTAAAAGFFARASYIDLEGAIFEGIAVEFLDRGFRFLLSGHGNEGKTFRGARITILNECNIRNCPCLSKQGTQRLLRSGERKVTNVQLIFHFP